MGKQVRIEITYNDDTTEEYIIHSDKTVEWIDQQKQKTVAAFLSLFSNTDQIANWFAANNAVKIEITEEEE